MPLSRTDVRQVKTVKPAAILAVGWASMIILNLKKTQDKVQFQDFNLEITNKKIVNKLCNCQTRLYFNSN